MEGGKGSFDKAFRYLDGSVAEERRKQQEKRSAEDAKGNEGAAKKRFHANVPAGGGGATRTKRVKPSVRTTASSVNAIVVKTNQRKNPVLRYITNVPITFKERMIPDYELGEGACGLYISLRYHRLHPEYLFKRLKELKNKYRVRVIFCSVDMEDNEDPLLAVRQTDYCVTHSLAHFRRFTKPNRSHVFAHPAQITKLSVFHECTLILAWSHREMARYIETFKAYENSTASKLHGKKSDTYIDKLAACLHQIRSVNKTDVVNLASMFGSLSEIMRAGVDELLLCPGIGPTKARRIYEVFHAPFSS
eukprot:g276.t1